MIEQLVFETTHCDAEVDDHGLAENLWRVVGIRYLSNQAQPKGLVILDLVVSECEHLSSCFSDDVLLENGVDNWVKLGVDSLEEHRLAIFDGVL